MRYTASIRITSMQVTKILSKQQGIIDNIRRDNSGRQLVRKIPVGGYNIDEKNKQRRAIIDCAKRYECYTIVLIDTEMLVGTFNMFELCKKNGIKKMRIIAVNSDNIDDDALHRVHRFCKYVRVSHDLDYCVSTNISMFDSYNFSNIREPFVAWIDGHGTIKNYHNKMALACVASAKYARAVFITLSTRTLTRQKSIRAVVSCIKPRQPKRLRTCAQTFYWRGLQIGSPMYFGGFLLVPLW